MGFVAKALGLKPELPAVPAAPRAPALADKAAQAAAEEERRRRAGKGRASTILTGAGGVAEDEITQPARKTLLGAGF